MCLKILTLITAINLINASPIIIRTGIGKLEDHKRLENGNVFGANQQSSISNFEEDAGFNKGQERKYTAAEDGGKYSQEAANKNHKLDEAKFGEKKFHKVGGGGISDHGEKIAHKKGHHKTGFHNSYHKDESGHNSSYFDDASDEGDEYNYGTKKQQFGDVANRRNNGLYSRGDSYNKADARQGHYNNAGRYEKDLGDRRNFNRERYYNDRKQTGRNNLAQEYGNAGHKVHEQQYTPQYQQHRPYNYDYPDRITIYEDPAYDNRYINEGYRDDGRYYDHGLEVRPPTPNPHYQDRYYQQPNNYDYYY